MIWSEQEGLRSNILSVWCMEKIGSGGCCVESRRNREKQSAYAKKMKRGFWSRGEGRGKVGKGEEKTGKLIVPLMKTDGLAY